jgi:phenylalanyl-tRNA synthetase alpha chain
MPQSLDDLKRRVGELRKEFEDALGGASDSASLQAVRDRFLGRKTGGVTALLKSLQGLAVEARRDAGQELNALKTDLESALRVAHERFEESRRAKSLSGERIDVTLPGRMPATGQRHPLAQVRMRLEDIFVGMGYEVFDGPEVDDDYHCFEALNMPPDHPARDMQDTFYLKGKSDLLLRTHTSTGQIRYMLANPHPPVVRIICPGKCYRRDEPDLTHSPMFHQIEALVVGPGITLGDLKGTIEAFLHALFGPHQPVRFRSSFFPYTEPSVEVDLGCIACGGSGCRVCKGTGWLEIMGSGMVHPAVFEAVNRRLGRVVYDPDEVTGFAFGLGIERVAILLHDVGDIRLFYESDLRFLEQFPG